MKSVVERIRAWRWKRWRKALFSDERSWNEYSRLLDRSAPGEAVPLSIRELGGHAVWCRPDHPDVNGLHNVFGTQFHLPPAQPRRDGLILDLGANLGYTMMHLAHRYPGCRVIGVEMDEDNFQMARRNLGKDYPLCTLVNAAVWIEDGTIQYDGINPEGLSIDQVREARGEGVQTASRLRVSPAKTIDTILNEQGLSGATIDYVKMDIEGAEYRVLAEKNAWLDRVRTIKVEFHAPATCQWVMEVLKAKGLRPWRQTNHWACVAAARP